MNYCLQWILSGHLLFNITVLSNTQFNALTAEIHDFVIHYFAYRVLQKRHSCRTFNDHDIATRDCRYSTHMQRATKKVRTTRLSLRHGTRSEATLYCISMDDVVNGFARRLKR